MTKANYTQKELNEDFEGISLELEKTLEKLKSVLKKRLEDEVVDSNVTQELRERINTVTNDIKIILMMG